MKHWQIAPILAFIWLLPKTPTILPTPTPDIHPTGKLAFVSTHNGVPQIYEIDMGANLLEPIQITHSTVPEFRNNVLPNAQFRELTFSRDGKRIAFTAYTFPYEGGGPTDIFVMNADGTHLVRLTYSSGSETDNDFENYGPAWSPNGKQIAFTCGSGLSYPKLCIIDSSSGTPLVLETDLRLEYGAYAPAWSPSGKHIAFVWEDEMQQRHIGVVNADGSHFSEIPPNQQESIGGDPAWSPDGTRIAFAALNAKGIYVMNADGSNRIELTTHDQPNGSMLDGQDVTWSPDGEHIAFSSVSSTQFAQSSDIYVVDPNGSHLLNLTHNDALNRSPAWSPDGKQIAFVSTIDSDGSDVYYVISVDGSNLHRLAVGLAPVTTDDFPLQAWYHPSLAWSSN